MESGDEIADHRRIFQRSGRSGNINDDSFLVVSKSVGVKFGNELILSTRDVLTVNGRADQIEFIGYVAKPKTCAGKHMKRVHLILQAKLDSSQGNYDTFVADFVNACRRVLGLPNLEDPNQDKPFLVFVNPKSGPGHAKKIWDTVGYPVICKEAGHMVDVRLTQRANDALDTITNMEDITGKYKGIIIVSGDGLIYEVVQGIMKRKDWAKVMRHMPIGVLPGGSGNGLAKTITHQAGLPHCSIACALIISRWHTCQLDLCAVDIQKEGESIPTRVYSFLSMEWGLIADIDIGSEYLRCIGEYRFTVEALRRWIALGKYNGKLEFLPERSGNGLAKTPKDLPRSTMGYWDTHHENEILESPKTPLLPPLDQPIPSDWITVEDTFWSMWNCVVPWLSGSVMFAPDSNLRDGYIQLQYLRERNMNRWKLLKWLLGFESGSHVEYEFNEMTPTRAYRFTPLPNPNGELRGIIALDGEVVSYSAMQFEILQSFLTVFAPDTV